MQNLKKNWRGSPPYSAFQSNIGVSWNNCMVFFWLQIEVLNPDDTPAQGVAVVIDVGQVQGITAANGMARLSINAMEDRQALTMTVSEETW